ncbi:hypothetical protein thsrh120_02440 [Rhizobium sp. No.120]
MGAGALKGLSVMSVFWGGAVREEVARGIRMRIPEREQACHWECFAGAYPDRRPTPCVMR